MKKYLTVYCLLVILSIIGCNTSKGSSITKTKVNTPSGTNVNLGKPLFLTPLIKGGKIKQAQYMSRVKPAIGNVTSYSGFLTTDEKCGNNLFFWFFPARKDWENAPLMLWLQGGPGIPSMTGLFKEVGPFDHYPDGLRMRKYSWTDNFNMLFIDQPVFTGYSFSTKGCYAKNKRDVGENLYSAIAQFLQLFPNLQKNKFFIAGESYAGHYIPNIGRTIDVKNSCAKIKINLTGMMIGNGWVAPDKQINYADLLYQVGSIDDMQREALHAMQTEFVQLIERRKWKSAYYKFRKILNVIEEYTSIGNALFSYLPQCPDSSDWAEYIQTPEVRKSIHVGNLTFRQLSTEGLKTLIDGVDNQTSASRESTNVGNLTSTASSPDVLSNLSDDFVKSMGPEVKHLLNRRYPMLFYSGQLDVLCGYPMSINFLRSLRWSGQAEYLKATRTKWFEGGQLAGYVKASRNLADVLVRAAGHMVPEGQPCWAYQMANRFVFGGIPALAANSGNESCAENVCLKTITK